MTKDEWRDSTSSLRKLIREGLKEPREGVQVDRMCIYKFGLVYNIDYRYFHIWNGGTKNTIATIKLSGRRAVVRYRKKSWYAGILQNIQIPHREMVFVNSNDLSRHKEFVQERIGSRVERSIQDFLVRKQVLATPKQNLASSNTYRTFGDVGIERSVDRMDFIVSIPLGNPVTYTTGPMDSQPIPYREIRVHFDRQPSLMLMQETIEMVRVLDEHDVPLDSTMVYYEVQEAYEYFIHERERIADRERARRNGFSIPQELIDNYNAPRTVAVAEETYNQLLRDAQLAPARDDYQWMAEAEPEYPF